MMQAWRRLARRVLLGRVDSAAVVQVQGLGGLVQEAVRMLPFGLASRPAAGVQALVVLAGGAQSAPIVLAEEAGAAPALAEGEALLYASGGACVHLKASGDVLVMPGEGGTIHLGGELAAPAAGLVTGQCVCAFTGAPHPQVSAAVRAKKEA